MWLGSDRNLYAPGESVPEVVTTLTAQWTVNQYTITYDLAGGTVEGNPSTYTIETVAFTLKNPTKSGYTFTGWSGTGLDGENNMTVTIPTGSTGNRTYKAHWRYNGSGHSYSYYTIKATAGAGGSISPSGNVSVREGRDRTFTITPDKGYAISNVKIDGKSIGAVKSYTFENVRRTHTIEVIFTKANGNPQTGVFVDVATGSYYEDAVDWAVENGITKGTDDTHFSPDGICTRAQAVTFLWRAAGSPKPETLRHALHRRSCGQLLLRCCAVGGRKRHHQGHQRHHVQPQHDLHPRPDRRVPVAFREVPGSGYSQSLCRCEV